MRRDARLLDATRFVPNVFPALHGAMRPVLSSLGFRWEIRRAGDLKIGLWRRTLRRSSGTSTPRRLIVTPGFGDSSLSWASILAGITPLIRPHLDEIVLLDFPGFTGFLAHEKPFESMDLLLETYGGLLDSLKPHTVFGHSLGGWLAASYGVKCSGREQRPERCGPARIIVSNPSGLLRTMEDARGWREKFDRARKSGFVGFRPHLFKKEPRWFKLLAPSFDRFFSDQDVHRFMLSIRADHLLNGVLGKIRSDMWVLWGSDDTLVPAEWVNGWLEELGGTGNETPRKCKGVLIRGAGHSPHIERPVVTALILAAILSNRDPAFSWAEGKLGERVERSVLKLIEITMRNEVRQAVGSTRKQKSEFEVNAI